MPEANRTSHIWRSPYLWLAVLAAVLLGAYGALVASVRRTAREWPQPVRTATAVGDSTCISCHRDKATFEQTAHRQTMRLPTRQTILGNFSAGSNVLHTDSPDIHFRMDADSTGFYQTLVVGKGGRLDESHRAHRVRRRLGAKRTELSLLVRPPAIPTSRVILHGSERVARQPGSGWYRSEGELQSLGRPSLLRVSRDLDGIRSEPHGR
jgi:hypothetical protein